MTVFEKYLDERFKFDFFFIILKNLWYFEKVSFILVKGKKYFTLSLNTPIV